MVDEVVAESVIKTVIASGTLAIKNYLEMSGDASARDIPELWLQCEIARAFAAQKLFYVFLERRMTDILHDANSGRKNSRQWRGDRITGNVDIALYGRTPDPNDSSLVAVIEIKKMNNDYCSQDDAIRMLSISEMWDNSVCCVVGGMFTCNDQIQANSLFQETEKRLAEVGATGRLQHSAIERDARGVLYSGMAATRVC